MSKEDLTEETDYYRNLSKCRTKALRMRAPDRIQMIKDNGWISTGHWDNWFHPKTGWNYNCVYACANILMDQIYASN
jgi:hypothetical protein